MEQHPPRLRRTSQFRRWRMVPPSPGWNKSRTNSTSRASKHRPKSRGDHMKISFENQVALVTGAASGLGLATAMAFAEAGASVVLADWNEKPVQSSAKSLDESDHK